jgi:lactoylglutathione lyase
MIPHIKLTEIILYVSDQERSKDFYEGIFRTRAQLHVPGMTEFVISENCKLGLMPESGIAKLLAGKTPHPSEGTGIPRCELYLYVDDATKEYDHAINHGAKSIRSVADMDWGDKAGYCADPDGHIIAFAQKN